MRIVLVADEEIEHPEALDLIARLVFLVADGWHDWAGPDPSTPILNRYFLRHSNHRELLDKSYAHTMAYSKPGKTIRVTPTSLAAVGPGATDHVGIEPALAYLSEPLHLMVENRRTDGEALEALFAPIDPDLVALFHETRAPLRWENGGGKNELRTFLDTLRSTPPLDVSRRRLIIVDSDSKWLGHEDEESHRLVELCRELDLDLHVLQKRAIEIYVPDRAVEDFALCNPGQTKNAERILQLTAVQRDFYPIKRGLKSLNSVEERALFNGCTAVHQGQPAALPSLLVHFISWKSQYSLADSESRSSRVELTQLVDQIRKAL